MEIILSIDDTGRMNIKYPLGQEAMAVYYLELAKSIMLAKSVADRPPIIPARIVP